MNKKQFISEKDIEATPFAFELQLQKGVSPIQENNVPQKYDQLFCESLLQRFLFDVRTGNTQDQIKYLLDLGVLQRILRYRRGNQVMSSLQFLERMQCFLRSQGLSLDDTVRKSYLNMTPCS